MLIKIKIAHGLEFLTVVSERWSIFMLFDTF